MSESKRAEILRLAQQAREWVASEEGLAEITKSAERDMQTTIKLREQMKIDDELLKQPFTV